MATAQTDKGGSIGRQVDRCYLEERFQRKPGVNADIATTNAVATTAITNPDFEVLGVNHSTTDVTFSDGGGIKCQTDGASADAIIITPHLDTDQTGWATTKWNTNDEVGWGAVLDTGSNIASIVVFAGLKLTNDHTVATDANQVYFRYADSGNWKFTFSVGGTDTEFDTLLGGVASTQYKLELRINSDRRAIGTINGVGGFVSDALTANTDLIPYIGVVANTAAAKDITIRRTWISKKYAD